MDQHKCGKCPGVGILLKTFKTRSKICFSNNYEGLLIDKNRTTRLKSNRSESKAREMFPIQYYKNAYTYLNELVDF